MGPLVLFAMFAGLNGYSIHKRWWGVTAFSGAMMLWMIVIQFCMAVAMHTSMN